jgi:hypothetical protein
MKKYIFILTILIAFTACNKKNGNNTYEPVISLDKSNYIFCLIKNHLSIAVPGYLPEELVIKCDQGVLQGSNGKYIFTYDSMIKGESPIIFSIYKKEKDGKEKLLGVKQFILKPFNHFTATLEGKDGGEIKIDEFKKAKKLAFTCSELNINVAEEIAIDKAKWILVTKKNTLLYESTEMPERYSKTEVVPGDLLIVTDIYVKIGKKSFRLPGALTLVIK